MPKPRTPSGEKNLISQRLIELRGTHGLSQRDLAQKLQLAGYDMQGRENIINGHLAHIKKEPATILGVVG